MPPGIPAARELGGAAKAHNAGTGGCQGTQETSACLCSGRCVSVELCGGTHVTSTDQIGAIKVGSEGGVASGVRTFEAHRLTSWKSYPSRTHQLRQSKGGVWAAGAPAGHRFMKT